ncbi:unnamed protein product [Effrenium voratum]|uniref:Uncharacterized protein n=1 Tax=Effrenium voratum TaxID=2562239 RepID=A0AA36I0X0_9DINO|nr:unnamed protein product [Effrenium voratum]
MSWFRQMRKFTTMNADAVLWSDAVTRCNSNALRKSASGCGWFKTFAMPVHYTDCSICGEVRTFQPEAAAGYPAATPEGSRGAARLMAEEAARRASRTSASSSAAGAKRPDQRDPHIDKAYDQIDNMLEGLLTKSQQIKHTLGHHNEIIPEIAESVERDQARMEKQKAEMKRRSSRVADGGKLASFEPSSSRAFGVQEKDYEGTRELFDYADGFLQVKATGQRFQAGPFEAVSCAELHRRLHEILPETLQMRRSPFTLGDMLPQEAVSGGLTFKNIVDSTLDLMADPQNAGAVFQVASLYNCLQLQEPGSQPEDGITGYADMATQGAVSSMACPAAAVFRNYFLNGGQGHGQQVELMSQVGDLLANKREGYWMVKNGFLLPRPGAKLIDLSERLEGDKILADDVSCRTKVGVHWDTQVVLEDFTQNICQVCCSAPAVAFSKIVKAQHWAPFAVSLLTGAYDATLAAATLLAAQQPPNLDYAVDRQGPRCLPMRTARCVPRAPGTDGSLCEAAGRPA